MAHYPTTDEVAESLHKQGIDAIESEHQKFVRRVDHRKEDQKALEELRKKVDESLTHMKANMSPKKFEEYRNDIMRRQITSNCAHPLKGPTGGWFFI